MSVIGEAIKQKVLDIKENQRFEKRYDFTRTVIAKKDKAGTLSIPMTTEGPFYMIGYNIMFSKNSSMTRGGVTENKPFTKLRFRAESDNCAMSNDYIPVELISTPGSEDASRYGMREFEHLFNKGDRLMIDYDHREPAALVAGDTYSLEDEQIEIAFTGYLYPEME